MLHYEPHLKFIAQKLRNDMTDSEHIMWRYLRRGRMNGIRFYRQKPLGPYIVDFYSSSAQLVIEVDGPQHSMPIALEQDTDRDAYLKELNLRVLRFTNHDVRSRINAVMEIIRSAIEK